MSLSWPAPNNVLELLETIKTTHHPHLDAANITVAFDESKPFIKDRFNWGNVSKFSNFNKLWQVQKYDFCIVICSDIWHSILDNSQREALLDLHLTRCEVEYIPEIVIEGKKKKIVKDEWGRVQYTNEIKLDDNGCPKWTVVPLDLNVICKNIQKYGFWCPELSNLQNVVINADAN